MPNRSPTLATASPKYRSALDLIKFFEGSNRVRTDAYLDSEGIPTIGWGATSYQDGRPVRIGDRVTPQQADQLLKFHMDRTVSNLTKLPNWKNFSASQQDALRSFAYNAGPNFMQSSGFKSMADAIRRGDTKAISDSFGLYTNGGNAGLKARRDAERALFNSMPRVNTPNQQGLYNPPSVGKQGPPLNPASGFNTRKMPTRFKNNATVGDPVVVPLYQAQSRTGDLTSKTQSIDSMVKLPGLNDVAQAAIGNYGNSARRMNTGAVNMQAWGSRAPDLGRATGVTASPSYRAVTNSGYTWNSTAPASSAWQRGFGLV
jgi:lysozyme